MIYNQEYLQFNPALKNKEWADKLISYFRRQWLPIVEPVLYKENMDLILSRNNMTHVAQMFKDPQKLGFEFIPIAVMEKIRNVLFGERYQAGLGVEIEANDPSSDVERNKDRTMLKNRKDFEKLITFLNSTIGFPEYSISSEPKQGSHPFFGNLEKFDEMGLTESNDQDLSYFFENHYKMLVEMDMQSICDAYMEGNEIIDYIEDWLNDITAVKTVSGRLYVNQVTGNMDYQYVSPDRMKTIPGTRNDHRTAICTGFEDSATVAQVIGMIGAEFDYEKHMPYLVRAVNFFGGRNIVEVTDAGVPVWGLYQGLPGQERTTYDEFSNMKAGIGYIEWKTVDVEAYKVGRDFAGNQRSYLMKDPTAPIEEGSPYQKEASHKWVTYKSHFLATSTMDQLLLGFGKLYHQAIEGSEDEYSNYSLFYKRLGGPSVADVARPWIELAQEIFYKFKWMVRKAKPKGRSYNYESLVKMAKHLINEGNLQAKVTQVIKLFEEGINEIYTLPEIGGEKMGGGTSVHHDLPNGLDPTALTFKAILEWCFQMISGDIGMNDVRTAESMPANSGYRLQMSSMDASRNATEYINYLIDWQCKEMAKRHILTGMDIVRYKDTVPYNHLKYMVGEQVMDRLAYFLGLRDKAVAERAMAPHRMGIMVHSLNSYQSRMRIIQQAEASHQKGEIPFEVLMLITQTKDWKRAAYILSYEKKRAEKLQQQQIQQQHDNAMQLDQQQTQNKMRVEGLVGQNRIAEAKTKGYFDVEVANIDNKGKIDATQMKLEAKPGELEKKQEEATKQYANKRTVDSQHDLPS